LLVPFARLEIFFSQRLLMNPVPATHTSKDEYSPDILNNGVPTLRELSPHEQKQDNNHEENEYIELPIRCLFRCFIRTTMNFKEDFDHQSHY
jgi:hypothetical protein